MQSIVDQRDNIIIFTLINPNVTGEVSAQLKAKMLILAQPDIDALIIDITTVKTVDSSGIGAFLLANRQLRDYGIPVVLCGVNDFILSIMKMTRIDNQFVFFDSVEDALDDMTEEEFEDLI